MKSYTKKTNRLVGALLWAGALAIGIAGSPATLADQEDYVGQVILVGFSFCPQGTVDADGRLLQINQNDALFSLYGTTYGGDGRTTFGVPDLQGRSVVGVGEGTDLSPAFLGQRGGVETVTLGVDELPSHSHNATASATLHARNSVGNSASPNGNSLAVKKRTRIYSDEAPDVDMSSDAISTTVTVGDTGGGEDFGVRDPFLVLRYCVVTEGRFPSRP
jgi:microcystin-dependent protein